jgi:hypothetical protein
VGKPLIMVYKLMQVYSEFLSGYQGSDMLTGPLVPRIPPHTSCCRTGRPVGGERYIYEALCAQLTYQIPDYGDRDGPRNVGFIQTPDVADSPRRLHRI